MKFVLAWKAPFDSFSEERVCLHNKFSQVVNSVNILIKTCLFPVYSSQGKKSCLTKFYKIKLCNKIFSTHGPLSPCSRAFSPISLQRNDSSSVRGTGSGVNTLSPLSTCQFTVTWWRLSQLKPSGHWAEIRLSLMMTPWLTFDYFPIKNPRCQLVFIHIKLKT